MMQKRFIRHDPHQFARDSASTQPAQTAEVMVEIIRGRARNTLRPVRSAAYLLGAAPDCDLVLSAPHFPEVYAYLLNGPQGVTLRHLGFVPELRINGNTASNAKLEDGDRIEIGPFLLQVHIRLPQRDEWGFGFNLGAAPLPTSFASPNLPTPSRHFPTTRVASQHPDEEVQKHVKQLLQDIRLTLGEGPASQGQQEEDSHRLRLFGEGEPYRPDLGNGF